MLRTRRYRDRFPGIRADIHCRPAGAVGKAQTPHRGNSTFQLVHLLLIQRGDSALNFKVFECKFLFCHKKDRLKLFDLFVMQLSVISYWLSVFIIKHLQRI